MANKSRLELWADRGFSLTDRLKTKPAVKRDIDPAILDEKLRRGSIVQQARLKRYPSIEVDFDELYAGTFRGSRLELKRRLFDMGFRNNPTAYVEITDKFGPDDGSFAQHIIKEDTDFPHLKIDRPLGSLPLWNRVKLQNHIALYEQRDVIHILAHQEASAWLQPARHLAVSEANAEIGIREFRESWMDEFGEELPQPL